MKERPILFNGTMVRAILDGRKTQTRRVVNAQPYSVVNEGAIPCVCVSTDTGPDILGCPYGHVGDRLWVRETWRNRLYPLVFPSITVYAADGIDPDPGHLHWRPSIHMPRWASRITLEVTGVRVERLQDISEEDAWKEGCERGEKTDNGEWFPAERLLTDGSSEGWDCAHDWFADLWDSINKKRGYGWKANPWVWVVEFRMVSK